jgi:pyruvate dehydrogenase E2 component (dihydrolipoamide acetyltransferase)
MAPVPPPAPASSPTLVGYGHDGTLDRSRRHPAGPADERPARPRAKPPVRRLARRLGVDLHRTAPTGAGGIVTRADVEAAATVVPVRGVRARIASHLSEAHATIPDASCRITADCTRLLEVRAALNDHAARRGLDPVVTPFSLLAHLVVTALAADPALNATYDATGPEIRVHGPVHLGMATATDRGLVVAVARHAEARRVHDLSAELARLAGAARDGRATPAELSGSTFTITNFGALGLDDGTPIINHPEAAILGVGAIRRRPHVVDDEVVARSTASLTLVFDHRVADGAEAARLLTTVRDLIERPELALLG